MIPQTTSIERREQELIKKVDKPIEIQKRTL